MWFKSDVMATVESAMQRRGWKYARVSEDGVITGVAGGGGAGPMLISIRQDEQRRTLVFLVNPSREGGSLLQPALGGAAPFVRVHSKQGHSAAQIAQVCEALLKLNFESLLGNMERDPQDGEIRFRVALPYRDTAITVEQVNWCIDIGVGMATAAIFFVNEIVAKETVAPLEAV